MRGRGEADPRRRREVTLALPVVPGQSEAYRRFIQERQETRRDEFVEACRRSKIERLTVWLAPRRSGDVVLARVELAADLMDVEGSFALSPDAFDQRIRVRARELHGVDLGYGVADYRAGLLGRWPSADPTEEPGHPS